MLNRPLECILQNICFDYTHVIVCISINACIYTYYVMCFVRATPNPTTYLLPMNSVWLSLNNREWEHVRTYICIQLPDVNLRAEHERLNVRPTIAHL